MRIFINHNFLFDMEQTALMLLPQAAPRAEIGPVEEAVIHSGEDYGVSTVKVTEKSVLSSFYLRYKGQEVQKTCRHIFAKDENEEKRQVQIRHIARRAAFLAITAITGERPAWGVMSGVRPAKLARLLLEEMPPKEAKKTLSTRFFVQPEKAKLAVSLAEIAIQAEKNTGCKDAAVYIGVPFCPSRCAYCSFIGPMAAGQSEEKTSAYLSDVCREIAATGDAMASGGAKVRALYVGGGTPTVFSAGQLQVLLETAQKHLPLLSSCEITVEAGRPDTISADKITVLNAYGVNRISVNPQSFSDEVLKAAGRKHTAEEAIKAYELVKKHGPNLLVNMDFIAGLPKDTPPGFAKSIETAVSLKPDNITVHTLALKRGAQWANFAEQEARETLGAMLSAGQAILQREGYNPYYLYRQKYMGGSFENIGYERNGTPCLYNIYMMEEVLPVVACGAGATTKLVSKNQRFRRIINPKFAENYSQKIEEILAGKAELTAFFNNRPCISP
jgi:oxygen-independent coproporphyrinogen-3 oxidase